MNNFMQNLPHLVMATIVIAATSALAATGTISGSEALPIIVAGGGVSLGAAAGLTTPAAASTSLPEPQEQVPVAGTAPASQAQPPAA